MRRTAQHPRLAAVLTSAALTAALAGVLAGCRTGLPDPAASGTSGTPVPTSSSAPAPSSAPSSPSGAPTAGTTASAGPNVLTAPVDGATVTGPDVVVTGRGTAFEATLLWRVTSQGTGGVAQEGFTTAGANGEVAPFSVPVTLDPGVYTVEVWEPDQKDGGDERHNLVSATFTVVG